MAVSEGALLPEGLHGQCPYTLLGLCLSNDGGPRTVHDAAYDEECVKMREALSVKAIGTAYRRAALKAHPDKNNGREKEAAAEFVKVNLAFAFLSDQELRESYHRHLRALIRVRQQREYQKLRWTQRDRDKQRFKEELDRKEAEARKELIQEPQKDLLQQIREQNEELLRRKQQEIEIARRDMFRNNMLQQQRSQEHHVDMYKHVETEPAEDTEDILYRSLLLSWPTVANKSEPGSSEATSSCDPSGCSLDHLADIPTPASLSSVLWKHGAIDLCFFSKSRGMACVSFTSRERAIEAALLLQNQRKSKNNGCRNTHGLRVKLANKAKGFEPLLQRVRSAADASEFPKQEYCVSASRVSVQTYENTDQDEGIGLARETEEAAAAFAMAIAAAQGSRATDEVSEVPVDIFPTLSAMHSVTDSPNTSVLSSNSRSCNGSTSATELRAVAATFGLGAASVSQPTNYAASHILAYVRKCRERGRDDARVKQAEMDHEKGWEWLGGSKVAATMSLEQLEAAAFGALERKKHQV